MAAVFSCPVEASLSIVPPKTEYSLTEYGKSLSAIIQAMCDWGNQYMGGQTPHTPTSAI